MNIWKTEPAMVIAVLQAAIALVTAFGLQLSAGQVGAIMAFAAAVLGFLTRSQVSPAPKPPSSGSGDGGKPVHIHLQDPDETPTLKLTGLALCCFAALVLVGCGLLGNAAPPDEAPPCDDASFAELSANCGDDEAECDRQISEREDFCAKRIQGEP